PTGLQNIGINYAFGSNQTISNNIFDLTPGAGNNTSSVAIQSNSLGTVASITGLNITGNTINVAASATPADPGRILGIWENSGAATLAGNAISYTGAPTNSVGISVTGSSAVTFGAGNSLTNGVTGLVVDGATSKIAGTGAPLNNLAFSGQTGNYITLSTGAM